MYESIVNANSDQELKEYCHDMVRSTKTFLIENTEKINNEQPIANYEELAVLYQEIISTWNKIYVCCNNGDAVLAYISGVCLQYTLNTVTRNNGLGKFD